MLLTHIPIHPASLQRWGTNVHGHLHLERILDEHGRIDPRYFCVSVEQIDYAPIELEDLRQRIRAQKEMAGRN